MDNPPILETDILFSRGGFLLEARFTLHSAWTVLFGSSGAGKTTLLRAIAGIAASDGNLERCRMTLHKRVLTDTKAHINVAPGKRRIGFVTQQAALFPHLTARENVAFGVAALPRQERETRVSEMLRMFGAEALANRRPGALSGGERQRIALARALAPQPELLLLDEPFAALDPPSRTEMIEALQQAGIPVIYVSHDLADAWQLNAEAVVIEDGRLIAQGEAQVVLRDYRERLLVQLGFSAMPTSNSQT